MAKWRYCHWRLSNRVLLQLLGSIRKKKRRPITSQWREIQIQHFTVHWYTLFRAEVCSLYSLKTYAKLPVFAKHSFFTFHIHSPNKFVIWIKLLEIKWDTKAEFESSHSCHFPTVPTENLGCYCPCSGCFSIALFLPGEICNRSCYILVSRQYYSSVSVSKGGPGGTDRYLEHFCATGFILIVALTFPCSNFRLTRGTNAAILFLCTSDDTSPNRTSPKLKPTVIESTRFRFKGKLKITSVFLCSSISS